MKRLFWLTEILLLLTTLIFSVLWAQDPSGNYEPYTLIFLVLLAIVDFIRRRLPSEKNKIAEDIDDESELEGIATLEGIINLDEVNTREYDLFYEKPFVRTPRLDTKLITGSNNYRIIEQRKDGFKLAKGGSSSTINGGGINLKWVATGEAEHHISSRSEKENKDNITSIERSKLEDIALSPEARTMLIEVSKSSDGTLLYLQHRGTPPNTIFQVSDKNLCPDKSLRTVAKWKRALDDLVEQEILQAVGYKGKIFKITDKGFTVADALQLVSSSSTETPKPDFFMERPSQKQSVEIDSSKESTIYQAGRDINLIPNPTEVGRIESVHLEVRLTCTLKENVEPPPSEVSFVPVGDSHAYFEGTPGRIRMSFVSPVWFRLLDGSRVIVINQFSLDSGSYLHHRPVNALANFESLSVPIVTVVYGNTLSSFTLLEVSLEVNGKAVWYGAWNYNVQFQTGPRFSLPLDQLRERLSA